MMRRLLVCAVVIAAVASAVVNPLQQDEGDVTSQVVSLLRDPGPSRPALYFSPVVHTGDLDGPVTAPPSAVEAHTPAAADWYIAQWNNPSPFTAANLPAHGDATIPPQCNASAFGRPLSPVWGVATGHARVCALHDATTTSSSNGTFVQVAASGGDALKCDTEFDMFLSPLGGAYPKYVPANMDPGADGWTLNNTAGGRRVTEIIFTADVSSDYVAVHGRCGRGTDECAPPLDYGYITIGLPIHNNVSREQNFFQVQLFDTRQGKCPGVDPCADDSSIGWYFRTLPVLGSNIRVGALGGGATCLRPGEAQSYRFDILPTLRRVVAEGAAQFGADGNLDHWHVNGLYIGQGLQGDTAMTTTVGNVRLEATIV
uniref:Secreted protein n=1 Tax=Neobodo designis TaxID=312471 RepID=A0A7S1L4B2_NEODS